MGQRARRHHLDGGVMGDPPDVGAGHVTFQFSGSRAAFEAHETTLGELGVVAYHGTDAGAASVEFMGQVAFGYELLIGLLHTLRLVHEEGIDVVELATRLGETLPALPPLLVAIAQAVRDGEYPPDLGPLSVRAALMGDLVDHRRSLGVDTVRMQEEPLRVSASAGFPSRNMAACSREPGSATPTSPVCSTPATGSGRSVADIA
jgi:hypothetical protein